MEREEIEKKLLESINKLEEHIERYEKDIQQLNNKIDSLESELDDAWNTFRTIFLTLVVMFVIAAITWFFPFQARAYGYLSTDDVQRKLVALSVEGLLFGILILLMIGSALSRRFRR
ncbi:MAG: hypothetical protein ACUVQF_03830 [Fervidobacterium sp.]|uniref:hypothetical protein n=1 Tax=Fervidobacterium sp. TaxID=1871331 RepID=UPI00404B46EC